VDDRVEIRSAGRLPAGITVEMLSGQHLSKLRNPLIADVFHRTGAVEIWGRGTNRVIEECRRYGNEPPAFEEKQGYLVVTFETPVVAVSGIGSEKSSEKILVLLQANPELAAREVATKLGLTSRAVEKQLAKLRLAGRIRRIGPAKGGHWEVLS